LETQLKECMDAPVSPSSDEVMERNRDTVADIEVENENEEEEHNQLSYDEDVSEYGGTEEEEMNEDR
jgi:hypothetical protein